MNHIALRGTTGEVRRSYLRAAELGAWTMEAGHLTATVVRADPYQLSQSPLQFVVRRPGGAVWSWPIEAPQVEANTLRAVLGPQQE